MSDKKKTTRRRGERRERNEKTSAARVLTVDTLARVEGEGALKVKVKDGKVEDVKLRIYEPPRFFEAFLRGRRFTEAPDLTARICGICPVAYQMSSCHALEAACGVTVDGPLRELRRLLYCGEWIESHALHVHLLHAPDFLGAASGIHLAALDPAAVERGLALKKLGNDVVAQLGGRAVHPINVRVGGFYRVPEKSELTQLGERLEKAVEQALAAVAWVAAFPMPDFVPTAEGADGPEDVELVALHHPAEYPLNEGRIISSAGLDIPAVDFEQQFREVQVPHSNALHSLHAGHPYLVGPLARYSLAFDQLTPTAQHVALAAGLLPVCRNPFQSIVVRAVELVYACEEALRIIRAYEKPDRPFVDVVPRAATGCAITEAPRGILYHRYRIDADGTILEAKIVPPTAQNLRRIELDVQEYVAAHLDLADENLTWQCEQAIRNYDPCISCATHFLKLEIERS
jgi:coenzyme F420-reducing hydrogenase alpha subunit